MLIMLKRLKRMPGGRSALHLVSSYDQYGTEMSKHDPEPADTFDCVNKPLYDCPKGVDRAGARCSLCLVRTAERSVFDIHFKCLVGELKMLILLKSLNRPVGGRVALHPTSAYDQYDTGAPNRDAKYNDSDPPNLNRFDDE